jgi:hypothetical protein
LRYAPKSGVQSNRVAKRLAWHGPSLA